MITNRYRGTLYIGVTSDLVRRIGEHRTGAADGFSKKYGLKRLVWYECHENMYAALTREKQLKEWRRNWKIELIEMQNPQWLDLYPGII